MKKILLLLAAVAILAPFIYHSRPLPKYILHLPNKDISLIVVNTPALRDRGLGGRDSLDQNTAMLFIFDTADEYEFWMKDMRFPIDIIWLDENYKIVHIAPNTSPSTYPNTFSPSVKSLYVLETNANFALQNQLKDGDTLNIALLK